MAEKAKQLELQKMQDAANKKELENVLVESEKATAEANAENKERRHAMAQAKRASDAKMKELADKLEKSIAKFEQLEDSIECVICYENFDDDTHVPWLLDCSHTICKQCLSDHLSTVTKQEYTCPTCMLLSLPHVCATKGKKGVHKCGVPCRRQGLIGQQNYVLKTVAIAIATATAKTGTVL